MIFDLIISFSIIAFICLAGYISFFSSDKGFKNIESNFIKIENNLTKIENQVIELINMIKTGKT